MTVIEEDYSNNTSRNVIVVKDEYSTLKKDVSIDEEDYGVVQELFSNAWIGGGSESFRPTICNIVETETEADHRICKIDHYSVGRIKFRTIPESLGRLTHLKVLNLSDSLFDVLPPSLGDLTNLRELYVWNSRISGLPDEIGGLTQLEVLDLRESRITSLPRSLGQLRSLRHLYLFGTLRLTELPEEVGNLSSIEVIQLDNSGIPSIFSLPDSIQKLKTLKHLGLDNIPSSTQKSAEEEEEWMWNLVRKLPCLGSLGFKAARNRPQLGHALARNRMRSRTPRLAKTNSTSNDSSNGNGNDSTFKQWPRMIVNAQRAFRGYPLCHAYFDFPFGLPPRTYHPDAVYQLLIDGRESFLRIILDRPSDSSSSN